MTMIILLGWGGGGEQDWASMALLPFEAQSSRISFSPSSTCHTSKDTAQQSGEVEESLDKPVFSATKTSANADQREIACVFAVCMCTDYMCAHTCTQMDG